MPTTFLGNECILDAAHPEEVLRITPKIQVLHKKLRAFRNDSNANHIERCFSSIGKELNPIDAVRNDPFPKRRSAPIIARNPAKGDVIFCLIYSKLLKPRKIEMRRE